MKRSFLRPVLAAALACLSMACGDKSEGNDPPCKTGASACFCYPNHTCDSGSTCLGNLCLDDSFPSFAGGSPVGQSGASGSAGDANTSGASTSGAGTGSAAAGSDAVGGSKGTAGSGGMRAAGGGTATAGTGAFGNGAAGSGAGPVFPPNPVGCALVATCPSCCGTTGVFALDALANDATARFVTAFDVTASSALAEFNFTSSDQVGAIFFHFSSPQKIGALSIAGVGTGGSVEVALVRATGKDGCIYPVLGGVLSPSPDSCWGLGAGPYALLPADQIEIRVRSRGAGRAALGVTSVEYGP